MELRLPNLEQLEMVYERDLRVSFPAAELKPLHIIRRMLDDGVYRPWCLFDGDKIIGECFLWLGEPGWALLDYLCVSPAYRNGGSGAKRGSSLSPRITVPRSFSCIFSRISAPVPPLR